MTRLRGLARAGALRVVGFILARPGLDAFLRRQVYRFPGMAGRMRAAVARSRRTPQHQAPNITEDDLTDAARQVWQDLVRARAARRQP